jgi:hypothetical protein
MGPVINMVKAPKIVFCTKSLTIRTGDGNKVTKFIKSALGIGSMKTWQFLLDDGWSHHNGCTALLNVPKPLTPEALHRNWYVSSNTLYRKGSVTQQFQM